MAAYDDGVFLGFLLKGALRPAMDYLAQFPEKSAELQRYQRRFEQKQYEASDGNAELAPLLLVFQQYYRDIFYWNLSEPAARQHMQTRFAQCLLTEAGEFDTDLEPKIKDVFESHGFHYLGGRTSGYFGPYIWKVTTPKLYTVELPEGTQPYRVNLLSDFLSKSWLDYISLGRISTGGWADADGVLNCVAESYDLTSEAFTVSLLKHEAQHAMDLSRNADLAPAQLEYRAKLVELIYSVERNLLPAFAEEADSSNPANAHGLAAEKIITLFRAKLGNAAVPLAAVPVSEIQKIAQELFYESSVF